MLMLFREKETAIKKIETGKVGVKDHERSVI